MAALLKLKETTCEPCIIIWRLAEDGALEQFHTSTKKGCSWWSCHYAWMCCQPCSGGKWTHNYNCWPNYSLIGDNRNKVSDFFSFTPLPAKRQSLERSALSVLIVPLPKGMHEPGIFQSGELFSLLHLREKNMCEMLPENLVETTSLLGWKGRRVLASGVQSLIPAPERVKNQSHADPCGRGVKKGCH